MGLSGHLSALFITVAAFVAFHLTCADIEAIGIDYPRSRISGAYMLNCWVKATEPVNLTWVTPRVLPRQIRQNGPFLYVRVEPEVTTLYTCRGTTSSGLFKEASVFIKVSQSQKKVGNVQGKRYKQTILITGSTDGIGRQTAFQIAQDPEKFVILHGKTIQRCNNVSNWIQRKVPNVDFSCVVGDFRNLSQVAAMAEHVKRAFPALNAVLLNAGVYRFDKTITADGFEEMFQVFHLAHFLLINRLLDLLVENSPSRIVATTSLAHEWVIKRNNWDDFYANSTDSETIVLPDPWTSFTGVFQPPGNPFKPLNVYSRNKLWNQMTVTFLARRLRGTEITANGVHPGALQTKLNQWLGYPVEQVRSPGLLLALPDIDRRSSVYFDEFAQSRKPNPLAYDELNLHHLWSTSEAILQKLQLW